MILELGTRLAARGAQRAHVSTTHTGTLASATVILD